eukprot:CAMPEP_0172509862 /NCGR_PEP_ID=MMETSP1066-20121228/224025_1 /TAXON_ID=671091 /ORGANISM="Coscinodiscus wailesii, Strain CCMP2513" /LENGTH=248 /DNA_ID=CAMNT_0013288569 /DNA_START=84 /DNA_END=830 /DNA_ORIENTATION=+
MGMVFGKVDVAEPAFEVMFSRASAEVVYEIRKYGKRFAIETEMIKAGSSASATDEDTQMRSPFMALAGYIGVMGKPQNEGLESIAMTAPVVMTSEDKTKSSDSGNEGVPIAMTAPVVMTDGERASTDMKMSKMQFILPVEYDDVSKIPKPTNPNVVVKELSGAVGAVHRFTGSFNQEHNTQKLTELLKQLNEDGVKINEEEAAKKCEFWGFNPPWTIPFLRRNEIWVELTQEQVDELKRKFSSEKEKE